MAASLADNIFKCIFLNENDKITIQISVKFVPRSPALVQVMAWCLTDEPMLIEFADAYMQHSGEMS